MKAIEKEPVLRYADAGEFAEDLNRYLGGKPVSARVAGPLATWARRAWHRRDWIAAAMAGGAITAAAFLIARMERSGEGSIPVENGVPDDGSSPESRGNREEVQRLLAEVREEHRKERPDGERIEQLCEDAFRRLIRALSTEKMASALYLDLCRVCDLRGARREEVLDYCNRAIDADRLFMEAYVERALLNMRILEDMGPRDRPPGWKGDEAAASLRQQIVGDLQIVVEHETDRCRLGLAEGLALYLNDDPRSAAPRLQEAAQALGRDERVWYWTGRAWGDVEGKEGEGIAALTRCLEERPWKLRARCHRARLYLKLQDWEKASNDYDFLIPRNSGVAEYYNERGLARVKLGRSEEAIEDFTKAIELRPDYVTAYLNRAHAFYWLGRTEEALQDCLTGLAKAPPEWPSRRLLEEIRDKCLKRRGGS